LRGYTKDGITDAIRAAGGEIYAVTSEPHSLAKDAQDDWDTGMAHVGDPHQEIAQTCRDRGWLSLFTNDWDGDALGEHSEWRSHPKGYYQPGVIVIGREGRVLYRWRCRPTRSNTGGATGRPTPEHVWGKVQAALAEPADAPDVAHDDDPTLDAPPNPWPLFVLLLLANGWFMAPQVFDHRGGEFDAPKRIRRAMLRLGAFLAGWVAAAWLLPGWIVGLAFGAWLIKVIPGIRAIHDGFQNVGANEEPA
jgi:hypothetical protein